jgi:hypothetical protein
MHAMTNKEYSEKVPVFKMACTLAEVKPTIRQASKYRNQKGSAFPFRGEAQEEEANQTHESISAMVKADREKENAKAN